ncbi:MAG: DMT family transporter [Hyphomicrobium sp.]|uniref:EamA family transporter n=1 Tax=Hyphomicrobium sp. TaxID=82 RepID=UPI0039E4A9F2
MLLICAGIITMVRDAKTGDVRSVYVALLNAIVIASYTLVDGVGTRLSQSPAAYAAWVFMLTGIPLAGCVVARKRAEIARMFASQGGAAAVGGVATVVSYAIVLHAMTLAPVAMVAALRETSILFGTAIAGLFLHERLGPARLVGAGLIGLGAVALRLA